MKKIIGVLFLLLLISSCGLQKQDNINTTKDTPKKNLEQSFSVPKNPLEQKINSLEEMLDKNNNTQLLDLAKLYLQYGNFYFQEETFAKKALDILNNLDKTFEVEYLKGYAYEIQTQYDKAIEQYNKALAIENINDKDKAKAINQIGHIYDLQGDIEKANEKYVEAETIDPENLQILINRGRYEIRMNNLEEAKKYFTKVLEKTDIADTKSEMLYNLSIIASSNGELDKAINLAIEGTRENKDYVNNYIALGTYYITKGGDDMGKAIGYLNQAIKLYPNSSVAYKNLGIFYYIKDDFDKAIENFKKQVEVSNKDILIMASDKKISEIYGKYDIARSYALKSDLENSVKYLKEVIKPENSDLYIFFLSEVTNENGPFRKLLKNEKFDEEIKNIISNK